MPSRPQQPDPDAADVRRRRDRRAELILGRAAPADAFDDADPAVRSAAHLAAAERDEWTTDRALAALSDPDGRVRSTAIRTVPRTELRTNSKVTAALRVILTESPHHLEAESAAAALGEGTGSDADVRALVGACSHEERLVREAAVAALGALGSPAGRRAVLRAMDDVATVRRRAVLALAAFEGAEIEEALRRASEDRDWQVRQGAEDLLGVDGIDDELP